MRTLFFIFLFSCSVFGQHGAQTILNRMQLKDIYHVYGGFQDSTASVAITRDQWSVVTNASGNLWGGTEADGISMANDTMVVTRPGDYVGVLAITFDGANTNEYDFRVYSTVQGIQLGFKQGATGRGDNNYARVTMPLYFVCVASDSLVLQVTNLSGNNPAVFRFAQFLIYYLHE